MNPQVHEQLAKRGNSGQSYNVNPKSGQQLYGGIDRVSNATQASRLTAAKAALYLLTGLEPIEEKVYNNMLDLDEVSNSPALVLTEDGGLRPLYHNGKDWLLLDCRAKRSPSEPNEPKVAYDQLKDENDDQAYDRPAYSDILLRNAIILSPEDAEKLKAVQDRAPWAISKLTIRPENFLSVEPKSPVQRRGDSTSTLRSSKNG
ncbi:hypothetical protein QFC24_006132 [Naganishia onofrii]|uniref:Uncharacterized protein n=1 Tax=Naganishia onofrii TaxID=1851511 RepID=A0ACC2X566_9TREE|nr:hypothetical protein QFC24_006132 [Naganishia onofrii]